MLAKSSGKLPFTASDVVGGSCVVVLLLLMGSEVGTLMCSAVSVDCEVFVAFCAAPGINNPSGFTIDRILDDVGHYKDIISSKLPLSQTFNYIEYKQNHDIFRLILLYHKSAQS